MIEELKPQALKRIQSRLVLEAVVAAENIETSEDELNKEIENMASMYQMEVDKLKNMVGDLAYCDACFTGNYPMEVPGRDVSLAFE